MKKMKRIKALEEKIETLKEQWPAHSAPPAMLIRLEELEDDLESTLREVDAGADQPITYPYGKGKS